MLSKGRVSTDHTLCSLLVSTPFMMLQHSDTRDCLNGTQATLTISESRYLFEVEQDVLDVLALMLEAETLQCLTFDSMRTRLPNLSI